MGKIRLDKFLSSQLNISRTDAKKLLKQRTVCVNGRAVIKGDMQIDTDSDRVTASGKELFYKEFIYIMLNKPKGVVSATEDGNDPTVIDILPENLKRNGLFPAGRLDKNTTGFVFITDNGAFAHDILSPAHHVPKTYIVDVEREVTRDEAEKFRKGMMIGAELFKPAELKFISKSAATGNFRYEIIITEGRYHQIKRMFGSTGNPVVELERIAIGNLPLDSSLSYGEAKELTESDIELLQCKQI